MDLDQLLMSMQLLGLRNLIYLEHPENACGSSCLDVFGPLGVRGLQDMQNLGNKYRCMALNHSKDR